jgi:hypothetical protein
MVDKTLYISGQIGFDPKTMEIVQVSNLPIFTSDEKVPGKFLVQKREPKTT